VTPDAEEAAKQGVIVVDAGGGTIDLSACSMHSGAATGKAISFEEIAPTEFARRSTPCTLT